MNYHFYLISILKLLLLFMVGSIAGWILEVFWRRFSGKKNRWINPGFVNGPWLPLYGFGTLVLYFICDQDLPLYILIPLFFFGMSILEFIAGIIFIENFKIQLWDYSHNWGNIRGLVCPFYSVLWTLLSLIFYFFIYPFLGHNIEILLENLELSFFIGIYFGIFGMDLYSSFDIAGRIKKVVRESGEKWQVDYETFKLELRDRLARGIKNRTHFLLPFHGERGPSLKERLHEHRVNISSPLSKLRNKENTTE